MKKKKIIIINTHTHTETKPALSNWSKFNVVTVNYPDKGPAEKKRNSHSWSTEKRSASRLTSSQLFINEIFHKQVKTWLADGIWNTEFKDNADMQSESPQKGESVN